MAERLTIWDTPRLRDLVARPGAPRSLPLPFPLGEQRCRTFSRARQALFAGVRQLGLAPGDEVLVPAFHHGSEIEALSRAGLACRFYEVGEDLAPDPDELDRLTGEATRALLLVHYLGRPQDGARWKGWCTDRGLLLLEDAAQSWMAEHDGVPVGAHGDLAIYCMYKTVPTGDGAALLCDPPPEQPQRRAPGVRPWVRAEMAARGRALRRGIRRLRPARPYDLADEFALGDPELAPSSLAMRLLPRLVEPSIPARRRENYDALATQLGSFVQPPFDRLPPGASPMILPLTVDPADKGALAARLDDRGVESVDLWADPHPSLPVESFPRSAALRARVVGVPVHQRLEADDLERIAAGVRAG